MIGVYIGVAIVAYFLGSISFSVIFSRKFAGFDVREKGSKNAGSTNVLRTVGKKAAALTLVCDVLKGVMAIVVAILAGRIWTEVDETLLEYIAGFFAILGHTFPIFFEFRGGKGVATALGVLITLNWKIGLICLIFAVIIIAFTKMVSVGSILAAVLYPILTIFMGDVKFLPVMISILIALLVIFNHRENLKCKFLPQAYIPSNIICTTDLEKAIDGSEMILIVTPSKAVRETIKKFKKYVTNQEIIICSKGFEKETLYTLNEVVEEELPNSKIGGLSGPSHAEEVSMGIPTALVIASKHKDLLKDVQETFMNEVLRIYTSDDVKGAELGGALKNILAFCAGIVIGQKLGDNTFAALLTRGLSEMSKLNTKMGGKTQTIYGLTGLRRFDCNVFK